MHDSRPGQGVQQHGVGTGRLDQHSQLAPRGRERAEVAAVRSCRPRKRLGRDVELTEHQCDLGLGGDSVVRVVAGPDEHAMCLARELVRTLALAGQHAQGRRVDRRVIARRVAEYALVQRGRTREVAPTGERLVLGDARLERRHVFVVDAGEAVLREAAGGLAGGPGARERQHRPVLQPKVVRVLRKASSLSPYRRRIGTAMSPNAGSTRAPASPPG